MEREFPKNVKQIGNVCDEPKIYVEDYVDTYLNQLKEKAVSEPVAAVLTGEILNMDGQDVVYVAGALRLQKIEETGTDLSVSEDAWTQLKEEKQRFFSGQDMVGWCLIGTGRPMGITRAIRRIHEKMFSREHTIFVWRDAVLEEEVFYASKFGDLMQMGGHYIFYEKNPSMQNYMINTRKKIGVTPFEMVEDRAAKNFRSTVREKMEYKEQRQNARFAYALSAALVLVVLVIGISTINNYDRMESVQSSLEALSQSVSRPRAEQEEVPGKSGEEAESQKVETEGSEAGEENLVAREGEEQEKENREQAEEEPEEEKKAETDKAQTEEAQEEDAAETSGAASGSESGQYYVVQKGDTLDGISIKVYGSRGHVDAICRMNGLADGNLIIIGQKLLLP